MVSRRIIVVRPEPGNARTLAALRAAGLEAEAMPLFVAVPLAWRPPDPAGFDALLLTSANAARLGGGGVAALGLPVVAVGAALARAAGFARLLHLAGRERVDLGVPAVAVYASEPLPISADLAERMHGAVVLCHSARAAARLADVAPARAAVRIAAISPAVLAAAGTGWAAMAAASVPTDAALVATAASLAHD